MKRMLNVCFIVGVCLLFTGQIIAESAPPKLPPSIFSIEKSSEAAQTFTLEAEQVERLTSHDFTFDKSIVKNLQGGEDIATATIIPSLPFSDTGHTTGYTDDYDEACVGFPGGSPDVVYAFTSGFDTTLEVSLCNSSNLPLPYFTHLWVYQNDAHVDSIIGCNRFSSVCTTPLSALFDLPVLAGETYYIVIDGENGQSGDYQLDVQYTPPPPPPTFEGLHPGAADGTGGYAVSGYEDYTQSLFASDVQLWVGTVNDGLTFGEAVAYNLPVGTYPSIDYWGNDSLFYGTFVPNPTDNSGGATYLLTVTDPDNSNAYSLGSWDWASFGWHDMLMSDIACDPSQEFTGTGTYRFGVISMVHTTSYPDGVGAPDNVVDGPYFFYQTADANNATISWFNDINGCTGTSCDIDKLTSYSYAVYDPYDDVGMQRQLFIRRDVFGDPDDQTFSGGWTYSLDPGEHIQYPAVASHDGDVVVVSEYFTDANPNDRDLICWYDPTGVGDVDALSTVVVTATTGNERFPRVTHIQNLEFVCTYLIENTLYAITTTDGGQTWGSPRALTDPAEQLVINEYRAFDLSENGEKLMYEYLDVVAGTPDTLLSYRPSGLFDDDDSDGILNYLDNCPQISNNAQTDTDSDGWGDDCDNCPATANASQNDADGDGDGDACDTCTDTDNDGYGDPGFAASTCTEDNCPATPNPAQTDTDVDGIGDDCDNCPSVANVDQTNSDGDTYGDDCDNCPAIDNEDQADTDTDLVGDVCDNCVATANNDQIDTDTDGHGDVCDNCPDNANNDQADTDSDMVGDVCDNCVDDPNTDQADADMDGIGDVCDGCCIGDTGNVDGDAGDVYNISDLLYLVDYFFLQPPGPAPVCVEEADADGNGQLNISDLLYMVDNFFLQPPGPAPLPCL